MRNKIICYLPNFINESGHEYSFMKYFAKIAKIKKLKIIYIVPKKNSIFTKKINFKKIIYTSKKKFLKLYFIIKNLVLFKKLSKKINIQKNDIFIVDGYSLHSLISFLIPNRNYKYQKIIIFCRYRYFGIKKKLFYLIIQLIKNKFKQILLVTDTTCIQKIIKKDLNIKIKLLPIPHGQIEKKNFKLPKSLKTLYIPGQFRKEKFGKNFEFFLNKNRNNKLKIFINKNFRKNNLNKIKFILLKNNLSEKNYFKHLKLSNIILMPYDNKYYQYRSSGIFVEAIKLGKFVLVSKNTWMSNELKKFNINELIIEDWKNFDLKEFEKIILTNKILLQKLNNLKNNYINFHNSKTFIKKFINYIK